jgi:uncharacterized membrane protein YgcG
MPSAPSIPGAFMRRVVRVPALLLVLAARAPSAAAAQAPTAAPSNPYEIPLNTAVLPFMLVLLAAACCVGVMAMVRGARRTCPHCRTAAQRLDGEAAAGYLDGGQRCEQQLGSVRYTVWGCRSCGQHEIQRREPRFGRRDACPECSCQTLRVDRETLESPTYDCEGKRRVEKDCAHCGWHDETMIAVPRSHRGSEMTLRKVLGIAVQAASLVNTIDSARDRVRGSTRGASGGENGGGDNGGSKGGHSSGDGASGRW